MRKESGCRPTRSYTFGSRQWNHLAILFPHLSGEHADSDGEILFASSALEDKPREKGKNDRRKNEMRDGGIEPRQRCAFRAAAL